MSFDMPWDVVIEEHKNVKKASRSNVKSVVAFVEVKESRILQKCKC